MVIIELILILNSWLITYKPIVPVANIMLKFIYRDVNGAGWAGICDFLWFKLNFNFVKSERALFI